jgi:hypothetical protein
VGYSSRQIYGESDDFDEEEEDAEDEEDPDLGVEDTVVCDDGTVPVSTSALPSVQKPHHQVFFFFFFYIRDPFRFVLTAGSNPTD